MTRIELQERVMGRLGLPAGAPHSATFLLEIVVASVVGWLIRRCLDRLSPRVAAAPGPIRTFRLERAIRRGCAEAAAHPLAAAAGLDAGAIYAAHGARVREAVLATGRAATAAEYAAFRAAHAPG